MPIERFWGGRSVTSSPSIEMRPLEGSTNTAIRRSVVVFPHPEGPRRGRSSPSRIAWSSASSPTRGPSRWPTPAGFTRDTAPPAGPEGSLPGDHPVPPVGPVGQLHLREVHDVDVGDLLGLEQEHLGQERVAQQPL